MTVPYVLFIATNVHCHQRRRHRDSFDADDAEQADFRESKAYRRLSRSRKLSEVDVLDYDAVINAWNAGMIVSAVCHGPAAFLGVTLDDGSPLIRGSRSLSSTVG